MSISIIESKIIDPDFSSNILFKENAAQFAKLMPEYKRCRVVLHIKENAKIVNAICRTLKDDLEAYAFDTEMFEIKTRQKTILNDDIKDRIDLIPIVQEDGIDKEISTFEFVNSSEAPLIAYSSSIKSNVKFNKTHRIVYVDPGEFLQIKNIKVVKGTGKQHAKFCLAHVIAMRNIDFLPVEFLTERRKMQTGICHVKDLEELSGKKQRDLIGKRIVIVPNVEWYTDPLSELEVAQIKTLDVLIEGTGADEEKLKNVKKYQATEYVAQEMELSFETYGTIEYKKLMRNCLNNIIARLRNILDLIKTKKIMKREAMQTEYIFERESYSIAEMLSYEIHCTNPSIKYCAAFKPHPQDENILIKISAPDSDKLLLDALGVIIVKFEKMIGVFK